MTGFIIKSSILLALFLIYYFVFLRNEKRFHFTRFYLLATLILAIIISAADFNLGFNIDFNKEFIDTIHKSQITSTIEPGAKVYDLSPEQMNTGISISTVLIIIYWIGFSFMVIRLIKGLAIIYKSFRQASVLKHHGQKVYISKDITSPFSFWKSIVVPSQLLRSDTIDHDIFIHERAHVKALHTLDVILIEILLTLYWFNPLLWIYKKLIKENHEFDADQTVLNKNNNFKSYSGKILELIKRKHHLILASTFNYSTIKNRIIMMKKEKSNVRTFSLKAIGSALIVALAVFTISCYNDLESTSPEGPEFVVVLDVGHGGSDLGVTANGITEKEVTLSLAKKIKELNAEEDIEFILSRTDDSNVTLSERIEITKKNNAQLLISLHLNQNTNTDASGLEVYYSNENPKAEASQEFSSIFAANSNFKTARNSKIKESSFFICKNAECPAVLFELGFATNVQDAKFLQSAESLETIARSIITSVVRFKGQRQTQKL